MPKLFWQQSFDGWLNLTQSSNIENNQFVKLQNFYYNKEWVVETRRGIATFWDSIWSSPITSYMFYQRDDDLSVHALCVSGSSMYKYNWTTRGAAIKTNLHEYETIPGQTSKRTRRDMAVYKNDWYLGNGVDPYLSYTSSTGAVAEIGMVGVQTCTFTNATNKVNKATHWLDNGDEIRFTTSGALPAEIIAYQVYYVVNKDTNDFEISTTKWWTALAFTDDWTGTNQYNELGKPRCRYISYLGDRIYGAGDDGNPTTLYYTDAAPADWTTISANVVVVWWDENGRINWLTELGQVILAFKSWKIYSINVATPAANAIDAMNGGYCDRSVQWVGNSLVYFSDKGVDTLKAKSGVTGASALEATPLWDDVRKLTDEVEEFQYNSGCAWYNKATSNYYFTFDTNNDNIPDTTLVYNSTVKARSQYTYPNLYDYGLYIETDGTVRLLGASATGWQMFELETWYQDLGVDIEFELETKRFDFDTPWLNKTFDYVDVIWWASLGTEITVSVKVDDAEVAGGVIDDSILQITSTYKTLGSSLLGSTALTGSTSTTDVDLYRYTIRIPMYSMWSDISVNMSSTGGVWQMEKMRISRDDQPSEVFSISDIA